MKKIRRKTNCWIWPYTKNGSGYGTIGRERKVLDAHRFLYEILVRKVPFNCELDHLCGNRLCVNPAHLEPVIHRENCLRGKQTKLTAEDVKYIKKMAGTYNQREIAERYGISHQLVSMILRGKRWA